MQIFVLTITCNFMIDTWFDQQVYILLWLMPYIHPIAKVIKFKKMYDF